MACSIMRASLNGQIRRIRYNGPAAVASANPTYGYSPLQVAFSSAGSIDPGGGGLTYSWVFGDGGTSTAPNPQHTYTAGGVAVFNSTLTVRDQNNLTSSATVKITVGSTPPTPSVSSPAEGAGFLPGQTVVYQGSATDPDDGALPPSSLSWIILLHHNTHVHTEFTGTGSGGSFVVEDHGVIGTFYYEILLTAVDSSGLSVTTSRNIQVLADTIPPTAPTNLTATATTGQVSLSWTASTDNAAVAAYLVERQGGGSPDFTQIGSATGTTYNDNNVLSNTTYNYRVRATDASANLSPYSNVATATTPVIPPGLVAAYGFGEGTGTAVADTSGNGNMGTINGATWTPSGKFGSALTFNGLSARVVVNDSASLHLSTAMTLEAWVNPSTISSSWRDVIYKGNDIYYLEGSSTNGATPAMGGTFSPNPLYGTAPLATNNWNHLAATYDGATMRLYVNGVQVASRAQTGNILSSANPLEIGGDSIYGQYFAGMIDEVRIYNRALNAAEVLADMNTPVGGNPPPQAPTISDIPDQSTTVNTPTAAIPFTVADADTPVGSLTVSGSSNNTTLVPNANIVFGGSGANRTVTVTPAANQTGSATITVTVSDGTLTASDTFVLTVSAVNTPPTISDIANQTTNEDTSTGAIAFTVGDAETPVGSLTVSGSSNNTTLVPNANIVFGGSGANRTVTVTPAANQNGTATITVSVSDGSLMASDTFVLTVNAVNDAPTISDIANQTISVNGTTGPLSFTVGDVETPAGSLTVSGSSNNTTLVPNGNIVFGGSGANRTVTVTPAANQTGSATITVTVSDGALTASDTFVLTVSTLVTGTQTFTNTAAITIPSVGAGTPYPSGINVTGMGGTITEATLTLNAITHQRVRDIDILLVSPGGQKVIVLSDVGPNSAESNITLTLSDSAASSLGTGTIVSGTYKPTNIGTGDTFAAPAPAGPYGTNLATFNGQSANGLWSLYVVDDQSSRTGSIGGGWSLTITTAVTGPAAPTISDIPDQATTVNTPTPAIPFTIGDADTPLGSLTVSGSSNNTTLVPNGNIVFGGSGANRTVTVTPATNQTGSATITVTVSDGALTASDTFVLTVSAQSAGLVAAYGFNEGTGTTVTDASGNGNNGTIGTATWTTVGKYGNALTFNGTSARVTVNDAASLHLTTGMTLEAWVNPTTVSAAWRDVIYKGDDNYYLEGTSNNSSRRRWGARLGGRLGDDGQR